MCLIRKYDQNIMRTKTGTIIKRKEVINVDLRNQYNLPPYSIILVKNRKEN